MLLALIALSIQSSPAPVPTEWLVLPAVEAAPEAASIDPLLFVRYLARESSPEPEAKERALLAGGESSTWVRREPSGQGRIEGALHGAFATVESPRRRVVFAQLAGADSLFVNGVGCAGDPNRRGFRGLPIVLAEGRNELFVAGVRDGFRLGFSAPAEDLVVGEHLIDGAELAVGESRPLNTVYIELFNATESRIEGIHLHFDDAVFGPDARNAPIWEFRCGAWIEPLFPSATFLFVGVEWPAEVSPGTRVWAPIHAFVGDHGEHANAALHPLEFLVAGQPSPRAASSPWIDLDREAVAAAPFAVSGAYRVDEPLTVYGTRIRSGSSVSLADRARYDAGAWFHRYARTPRVYSDERFVEHPPRTDGRRIVYGNADTNGAWSLLVPEACPVHVSNGLVEIGDQRLVGEDLCVLVTMAGFDGDDSSLVLLADTGEAGRRLGQLLRPFDAAGPFGTWTPNRYLVLSSNELEAGRDGVVALGPIDR